MRLVAKTVGKVVIEITTSEIEKSGFDFFWDKIRKTYSAEKFSLDSIASPADNDKIVFIELISNKIVK